MLNRRPPHRKQQGVVLLVAIIALVALTLAALALTRSVYTSNVIAGNLAFQRSATHSAELGLEVAMQWLEASKTETAGNCGGPKLYCHQEKDGYAATRLGDDQVRSWLDYWQMSLAATARTLPQDAAGNTVSYVIERMCSSTGDPLATATNTCTASPRPSASTCSGGSSCAGGENNVASPPPVYYRITILVRGPRNAQSLVQAMVSL